MGEFEYKEQMISQYRDKSEIMLRELPAICRTYCRGVEGNISSLTLYEYLTRQKVFFSFLREQNPYFGRKDVTQITYDDLALLEAEDIEEFTHYIRSGNASHSARKSINLESSVNHYLCALNSLWDYCVRRGRIQHNIIKDIHRGRKRKQQVITLDENGETGFLNSVNYGSNLSKQQQVFRNDISVARDNAICLMLMKTGLRVSELVGINTADLDLDDCCVKVMRKEAKADEVFFSDHVKEALLEWLEVRNLLPPAPDENALFLVTIGKYKGQRLSVRSVQLLVKKYFVAGAPKVGKKGTPHKLRSTFATDYLRATGGDITLVQEALNHESPSTTSIYLQKRKNDLRENRNILDS